MRIEKKLGTYTITKLKHCLKQKSFYDLKKIALIVLPTGCGKSGIAVLAPYVLGARRVLVVTPSITITNQLGEDIVDPDKCFIGKTLLLEKDDARL